MLSRNRFRVVVNRYLNEDTYKLIKSGYLAVHKRPSISSAEELEEVKNAIVNGMAVDEAVKEEKYLLKAGHGGTLDSMATGVLAVGLCDGCKVLPYLSSSNKRYTVTGRLGVATDTYNCDGKVVAEAEYSHVTEKKLKKVLEEFHGEIWQVPPVYSALKIHGERSSDLVRSGREVKLLPRPVLCYSIHCMEFNPPYFTLDVSCGSGFYVRSLVHDLAEELRSCAHVTALVRTKHGPFTLQDCLHPEHYTCENIIAAVQEARMKYPNLAKHIRNYFKGNKRNRSMKLSNQENKEDSESNKSFISKYMSGAFRND